MSNKVRGITSRWLTGNLGVFLTIIIVVELLITSGVRYFYYNSAQQNVLSQLNTVSALLEKYAADPSMDYTRESRNVIEKFDSRSSMELMALDINGKIITTSSGFEIKDKIEMPDFNYSNEAENGLGFFRGEIGKENVIAVTAKAPETDSQIYAVRIVASLEKMDDTLNKITFIFWAIGAVIIVFMIISGMFFVRSIVIPVGEVSKTAKSIAEGDFKTRLEIKNNDEIGELCQTINDMAEELGATEKMKNDFISSISHELRTPLTAIKGWSETILSDETNDEETLKKGLNVINSETERLSLMVEELLDFSRLQSGRLKFNFGKCDLLAELEEAVLIYTEKAKRENIELNYDEKIDCAIVIADKNRMRQVFINIIDNAIKYSDAPGKVDVTIEEANDNYIITVKDCGCGIKAEDLPKIKQKFYKANTTRRGSGIGLALADEIIRSHYGNIDIDSVEGQGTTVKISLPNEELFESMTQGGNK